MEVINNIMFIIGCITTCATILIILAVSYVAISEKINSRVTSKKVAEELKIHVLDSKNEYEKTKMHLYEELDMLSEGIENLNYKVHEIESHVSYLESLFGDEE